MERLKQIIIRNAKPSDHSMVIDVMPQWWGGRDLSASVLKVFFIHFYNTTFIAHKGNELGPNRKGRKKQMNDWYETLQRPALTPPNWIFGPVWTVLYIMIAVSIFLFIKNHRVENGVGIYFLIAIHLIANFSWTAIFFRLQSIGFALIDIVVLDISLILMIYFFWHTNRIASTLLWPYLLWVLFATYLNLTFYVLNKT